mgnify:CR=1 FL=1
MNFKKLSIKNFGCFIGDHTFNFASANDNKNITLIQGQNNSGKTTIMQAVQYCLWGEITSSASPMPHMAIINEKVFEKARIKRQSIETSVCLDFEHNDVQYSLKRYIFADVRADQEIRYSCDTILDTEDKQKNTQSFSCPNRITETINTIIDYRVRNLIVCNIEIFQNLLKDVGRGNSRGTEMIDALLDILGFDSRKQLSEAATGIARILLPEYKYSQFSELIITENNTVVIHDTCGNPIQNIMPMCDIQSVTVAVILGLHRILAIKNKQKLPLMLNEPFERMDAEHQKRLIEGILNEKYQFVILAKMLQENQMQMLTESGRCETVLL